MNKLLVILFLFATVASFSQTDKYGKEISLKEKTSISKILDKPEKLTEEEFEEATAAYEKLYAEENAEEV